jgi:hypothetical protein
MESKSYTIKELFDNASFKKFAPIFLEKESTVSEVANKSGISRQTIIHLMKSVERYVISPNWSPAIKGRPIHLDSKILTDYLAAKLGLEAEKRKLLNEIIHNPSVNLVVIKNNDDLDTCVSKVVLTILLIGSGFYDDELPKSTPFTADFLFEIFLTHKSSQKVQSRTKVEHATNKPEEPKIEKVEVVFNSFGVSAEEFENWKLEVHKYAKSFDNNSDFWNLLIKVKDLRSPIVTYPYQWFDIFSMTIPALLSYSNSITQKYKRRARKAGLLFTMRKEKT